MPVDRPKFAQVARRLYAPPHPEPARTFNPANVRATFERVRPELLHGDRAALLDFIERDDDGTIHSGLHKSHVGGGA